MNLEISNIQYNLIRKKLRQLEEVYKQSNDANIRLLIKNRVFFDLCMEIENFYERFNDFFDICQMSSLKQIDDLSEAVLSHLDVERLQQIGLPLAKKTLKLKDKPLNSFVRGFNEAIKRKPLTYYSQQIDEKFIVILNNNGKYIGIVGNVSRQHKMRESVCHFCNSLRRGDEIVFITNTVKTESGEYSSLGQYCCLDYNKCNSDIVNIENLTSFMTYGGTKVKR